MQSSSVTLREYAATLCENLGIIKKTKQNKSINAIEEQTIHEFKIFNTRLIISGFIAVF